MTIPMVSFVGRSGSGKTTLLVQIIAELRQRGYRLASVKHRSHGTFALDHPGKDSWRHAQAGSEHVVLVGPSQMASFRRLDRPVGLEEAVASISGVDIILVEGYKEASAQAIEVVRGANSRDLVGRPEQRIALVTDTDLEAGVPRFDLDDVQGIVDFIEARFLRDE